MGEKKPYMIAITIQMIYTAMFVISKAAFDQGMNTFVFIFYRQAASTLMLLPLAVFLERKNAPPISFRMILKLFLYALIGNTFSLNLYNVSMKLTSATVASATFNSHPVVTFCLALLLRMEAVKLRSSSGIAKITGIALCFAGVLVIALYIGPGLIPINHRRVFPVHAALSAPSRVTWIKGTFLMVLANMSWSLGIVKQAAVLEEYPNKLLVTLSQCAVSTVQSFVVAVAAERDFAKWKLRLDISLLAIIYTGLGVNGVSYYLQAWCVEKKGPVFLTVWTPLCFVFTMFCSSLLGETVRLGSIIGGILLVGGLHGVLWGKSKEGKVVPCNKVNTMDTSSAKNDQEHETMEEKGKEEQHETMEEKGREEQKQVTSASMVENVLSASLRNEASSARLQISCTDSVCCVFSDELVHGEVDVDCDE